MAHIFGWEFQVPGWLGFLGPVGTTFAGTLIAWLLIALAAYFLLTYVVKLIVRRIPGKIDDIVLGVVRRPLFILAVVYGLLNALTALPLTPAYVTLIRRISDTAVLVVVSYILWRVLEDVIVYFGELWVKKTENRVDDILMPVVRLFGPLVIGLTFLILVLGIWGINVTSVLVGAGVLGLVLGLAMQDVLSNVFAGLSLIIDSPFRTGDIINLPGGPVCQVMRVGMRATQLYNLDENSMVYVPNKELAGMTLSNITRPSVDLRAGINLSVAYGSDLQKVSDVLLDIAGAHPNVLGGIEAKIASLSRAAAEGLWPPEKLNPVIARLEMERRLDLEISGLEQGLESMLADIRDLARGGLSKEELARVQSQHLLHVKPQALNVKKLMADWSAACDPWAFPDEQAAERERWDLQNAMLVSRWQKLEDKISRPGDYEMRLEEMTQQLLTWVKTELKPPLGSWKEPSVSFKSFGTSAVNVSLEFFVDNIRMEHNERKGRVVGDIAGAVYRRFQADWARQAASRMEVVLAEKPGSTAAQGSAGIKI